MRAFISWIIFFSFIPEAKAQLLTDVVMAMDSTFKYKVLAKSQRDTLKLLEQARDIEYLSKNLDTTRATLILIVEGYRFSTREYGIREEYYYDTTLVTHWQEKCLQFYHTIYLRSIYDFFDTVTNYVGYFRPNPIVLSKANRQENELRELRRLSKGADKKAPVKEDFFNLTTLIDRRTKTIRFRLNLPGTEKRLVVTPTMNSHLYLTRDWLD